MMQSALSSSQSSIVVVPPVFFCNVQYFSDNIIPGIAVLAKRRQSLTIFDVDMQRFVRPSVLCHAYLIGIDGI